MFSNMLLNPNYDGEAPKPPARLYARIDQSEGSWLAFDTIAADHFDSLPEGIDGIGGADGWATHSAEAPIFVLWVNFGNPLFGSLVETLDDEDIWFEILLEAGGAGAILYFNLFRDGVQVGVNSILGLDAQRAGRLSRAFSLKGLERTPSDLQMVLGRSATPVEWIGVYDVGQGNANAACDAAETPLLYFDLGGGVTQHHSTFPSALTDFCYKFNPPVVLSHWDWDHWSSGARFPGAQGLDWVVPLQNLGGVHATFAAGLHNAGHLYVWPGAHVQLSVGQVTVRKCTGQGTGRNHTGLAVEVKGPAGQSPILLTGDARYSAIPGATASTFTSLVVPHHGADMRSHAVPAGKRLAGARTAYSFGPNNSYRHPRAVTQQDHDRNRWPQSSQNASHPIDRSTSNSAGVHLGNIGLAWSSGARLPGHNCGVAGCAVRLRQT
jgi:hypothetical protein